MRNQKLQGALLRAASLLAPGDQRAGWLEEWRSELWYIPRRRATRFCLGAFRDALWLRRNSLSAAKHTGIHLESPLSCLAFLALLAVASTLAAVLLPAPKGMLPSSHLRARDLPLFCVVTLLYTGLLLPVMRLAMGRTAAGLRPVRWPHKLRRAVFLALKIALVQPMMFCGFAAVGLAGTVPVAPIAVCAFWMLTLRWVLIDQQRRCPVCLRLLTNPVRIGTPSRTFLEWYGAESMCARGHGLLQVPEVSTSSAGGVQWLRLDTSWSSFFVHPTGARQ